MRIYIAILFCVLLYVKNVCAENNLSDIEEIVEQMNYTDEKSILYHNNTTHDLNVIVRVKSYLNNIDSMIAEFIQIAPDGTSSDGMFFLSRPGKLRWQYNPPTPVLIIINNDRLIYYDYELNEVTYTNTHEVLGSFLTASKIDFNKNKVRIDKTESKNNMIRMEVSNLKNNNQKMVLVLSDKPMELKKIEFYDDNNKMTSVSFHNAKYNLEVDKNLFMFKNPRIFGKK